MDAALALLALAGFAAVAWRALRAALRAMRWAADGYMAREVADVRARRGDLTGMEEAVERRRAARRSRWRAGAALLGWLALLVVPALLPWTRALYAACALLWLAPAPQRMERE